MLNPRLASRYAKSLLILAKEQGNVDVVQTDMEFILRICGESADFSAILRSPVIQADKKIKVIAAVIENKISTLTFTFIQLLVKKGREAILSQIAQAFIEQYYVLKGIHKVKLTTAGEVTEALKSSIIEKVKKETGIQNIELEAKTNEALIGGFQLEYNGSLIDASIARDLRDVKHQFQTNVYIRSIR